eukprot:CAMPEP_0171917660 /NCGR_PEP_ID=MMETSP0993-20121228/16244_1 /TAXON_ID=483369 /ORGANISM="non described non described, Strain CCMP2098" /LENGTH=39 /DNA_ID= /DNA_START= /DNA_END= /DNA_ORIENTATION=
MLQRPPSRAPLPPHPDYEDRHELQLLSHTSPHTHTRGHV